MNQACLLTRRRATADDRVSDDGEIEEQSMQRCICVNHAQGLTIDHDNRVSYSTTVNVNNSCSDTLFDVAGFVVQYCQR